MPNTIDIALFDCASRIADITTKSPEKDQDLVVLSYLEELGELAAELKIHLKVVGTEYKSHGKDGVYGECADLWICGIYVRWSNERFAEDGDETVAVLSKEAHWTCRSMNIREATKKLSQFPMDIFQVENIAIGIALNFDPDIEHFIDKINEKLDKWEANLNK